MNARQVSAMFAAYVWFTDRANGRASVEKDAMSFARENWRAFLPGTPEGLGRLLLRIAEGRSQCKRRRRATRPGRGMMAGAVAG